MAVNVQTITHNCLLELPNEILHSSKPLLIPGLVLDWPIVRSSLQSYEYFKNYLNRFYTGRKVGVFSSDTKNNGRFFYNEKMDGMNFSSAHERLDEVLNEIETNFSLKSISKYVGSTTIDTCLPGFRTENDLVFGDIKPLVSLWLGTKSRIAAHYDAPMNIACNVAGKRKFTLFPPEQIKNLYVGPLDYTPAGQSASLVDFVNPDFEQFPKFAEALKYAVEIELSPGDAILIPSMWWHHVEALDDFNALINYWWRNTPAHAGAGITALQHSILALRDLPKDELKAWKDLFEYYVFDFSEEKIEHIPKHARGILNELDDNSARKLRAQILNGLNR